MCSYQLCLFHTRLCLQRQRGFYYDPNQDNTISGSLSTDKCGAYLICNNSNKVLLYCVEDRLSCFNQLKRLSVICESEMKRSWSWSERGVKFVYQCHAGGGEKVCYAQACNIDILSMECQLLFQSVVFWTNTFSYSAFNVEGLATFI